MIHNAVVHELKFTIHNTRANDILAWLDRICEPDPEFPHGTVSSIYYDTLNWTYLNEKLNSYYLKKKVRLRWYSDLDYRQHDDVSFLEVKYKIGGRREKYRVDTRFTGTELAVMPLESRELVEVTSLFRTKEIFVPEKIFPAFQISYRRHRYIDPYTGSRICFDYHISAPRTNRMMMPYVSSEVLQTAVFEIKGPESELPSSLYPLTDMGLKKSAFSKYSSCYHKLTRRHY